MNIDNLSPHNSKLKLIVSTLGFTPELVISNFILDFISQKGKLKPLFFLILFPKQSPTPTELQNAINSINNFINTLKSENLNIQTQLLPTPIDHFDDCVTFIISSIGNLYSILHIKPHEIELIFNLSGGMNILILSTLVASQYTPTSSAFTTIENTSNIRKLYIDNIVPIINQTRFHILKTLFSSNKPLSFDQIHSNFSGIRKNRSTIYRTVKKMVHENLLTISKISPKHSQYLLTLHGKCTFLSLHLFPSLFHLKPYKNKNNIIL